MWEAWVQSLGWEDPLEKGKASYSSILALRIPWTVVHGVAKSWTELSYFYFQDLDIIGLNPHSVSIMLSPRFLQILLGSYSQGHH